MGKICFAERSAIVCLTFLSLNIGLSGLSISNLQKCELLCLSKLDLSIYSSRFFEIDIYGGPSNIMISSSPKILLCGKLADIFS